MQRVLLLSYALGAAVGCGSVKSKTQADAAVTTDAMVDAAPAECGDGRRDPGEVCFGQPIVLVGNDVTYDAHLADEDGDGDLDLVYLIGDQYKVFPQQGGQFAGVALDGPTTFSTYARSLELGGSARLELVDAGDQGISTWRRNAGNTAYELINTAAPPANTTLRAFGMGKVTGSPLPNPVGVYTNNLVVGTYNTQLILTTVPATTVQGTVRALDIAKIDADAFEDVAIATSNGVVVYRGTTGGVQSVTLTPQTASTDGVAIGDIDDDDIADIAYAVAGATGQVGVMRGVGGAAFLAPLTQTVADLGDVLDTGDVDGDGRVDVIVSRAKTGANAVLVMLGKMDGSLADPIALPVSAPIDYLRCEADFNGDGAPDCVTTDINSQNMIILPSNP